MPPYPDEVVVVGSFRSFDTVLTPSHFAIYSEIHFTVDKTVFPESSSVAGPQIDILEKGGSVSQNGNVLTFPTIAQHFGIVPSRRYLLFVRHISEGDFYLLGDSITLQAGIAKPNSADAVAFAKQSEWPFTNMHENELVQKVSDLISLQQSPSSH